VRFVVGAAGDRVGEVLRGAEVGDELCVGGARASAGFVVEVEDVGADVGVAEDETEEGDAVGAAADGDGPGAGGDAGEGGL
jgi:hypothetical protein